MPRQYHAQRDLGSQCKFEICTEEITIQSETYPTQRPLNIKRHTTANSTVNFLQRPKCHQVRLQQTSNPQPTRFSLYAFSICFLLPYMLIQASMLIPTYPSCPIYMLPHRHRQFLCASAPENYFDYMSYICIPSSKTIPTPTPQRVGLSNYPCTSILKTGVQGITQPFAFLHSPMGGALLLPT